MTEENLPLFLFTYEFGGKQHGGYIYARNIEEAEERTRSWTGIKIDGRMLTEIPDPGTTDPVN